MTKEAIQSNTYTKEARPINGTAAKGGFDRRAFGHARFGETYGGYTLDKEALQANSQTKEALPTN